MSLLRSRFPTFYRFIVFTALLAMLVPLATGLVHHPEVTASPVHTCGMDMGADSHPHQAPPHKLPICPICQSMHLLGAGFVPPDVPVVAAVSFVAAAFLSTDSEFLLTSFTMHQAQPRAPPVFI